MPVRRASWRALPLLLAAACQAGGGPPAVDHPRPAEPAPAPVDPPVADAPVPPGRCEIATPRPDPDVPRGGSGSAVVAVGCRLFRIGGAMGSSAVRSYDLTTGRWSSHRAMQTGRQYPGVAADDARIYVVGGAAGLDISDSAEVYDVAADRWSALPPLPRALQGVALARYGRALYAFGGDWHVVRDMNEMDYGDSADAYVMELPSGQWEALDPMPVAMTMGSTVVVGDRIWVLGGKAWWWDRHASSPRHVNSAVSFHPATGTWRTEGRVDDPCYCAAVPHAGGIVAFGREIDDPLAPLVLDAERRWTVRHPRSAEQIGRFVGGAALVGEHIIVDSARTDASSAELFRYEPSPDHWTRIYPAP